MVAEIHEARPVPAGRGDPIRIVPLQLPADVLGLIGAAPPVAAPALIYRGGHLLTAVKVFTCFWGAAWEQAPQSALIPQLNDFFDAILTSPLLDQLAEYTVAGQAIGHGRLIGTAIVTRPRLHRSVPDSAIRHLLQQEITTNPAFPAPDLQTLYFVYLPPGVSVVQGGSRSCQAFCGYHDAINSQIFYAVMPYPGCGGCVGSLDVFEALTSTSSHELAEAITDADPGQGWYDDANGEIGDICAWQTKSVGAYTVQQEWSNAANRCV